MPRPPVDPSELPSIERLRELVYFDGENLRRKVRRGKWPADAVIGCDNGAGYLAVRVDGRHIKAHRVSFALHFGRWPLGEIDHIDGVRSNNRPENLREVTRSENLQNRVNAARGSRTGYLGVTQNTTGRWAGRFRYRITAGGRRICKDGFRTAEEAHAAYLEAKRALHPFAAAAFR